MRSPSRNYGSHLVRACGDAERAPELCTGSAMEGEGVTAVWEEGREDLARYHVTVRARYHVTVRETLTLIRVGNTLI
jgi:hypothetical protein